MKPTSACPAGRSCRTSTITNRSRKRIFHGIDLFGPPVCHASAPKVKEAMTQYLETVFGNPSSDNQIGQPAAVALEKGPGAGGRAAQRRRPQRGGLHLRQAPRPTTTPSKAWHIGLREKGRHIITSTHRAQIRAQFHCGPCAS